MLTKLQLEQFDPHAPPPSSGYRRYLCPLPACAGKTPDDAHRSLSVHVSGGWWRCFRCGDSGTFGRRLSHRRSVDNARARLGFTSASNPAANPSPRTPPPLPDLTEALSLLQPIAGTHGERYLASRGIPLGAAQGADVSFAPRWFGPSAVVFPIRNAQGQTVALGGRYTTDRVPKVHTKGALSQGVFSCLNALACTPLIVVEGPCDALSLAICGSPSIALHGVSYPRWLPAHAASRLVLLALDADDAGHACAQRLSTALRSAGAEFERMEPFTGKDWNDCLRALGRERLSAELTAFCADRVARWKRGRKCAV